MTQPDFLQQLTHLDASFARKSMVCSIFSVKASRSTGQKAQFCSVFLCVLIQNGWFTRVASRVLPLCLFNLIFTSILYSSPLASRTLNGKISRGCAKLFFCDIEFYVKEN